MDYKKASELEATEEEKLTAECEAFKVELEKLIEKHGIDMWCCNDGSSIGISKGSATIYALESY
mgnify:CR=1 FL=1